MPDFIASSFDSALIAPRVAALAMVAIPRLIALAARRRAAGRESFRQAFCGDTKGRTAHEERRAAKRIAGRGRRLRASLRDARPGAAAAAVLARAVHRAAVVQLRPRVHEPARAGLERVAKPQGDVGDLLVFSFLRVRAGAGRAA